MSHNNYRIKSGSPKELLTAFTPRAKLEPSHSLISNHMKAHYKRIASVQAKIDSHPPASMLKSIKAKEHPTLVIASSTSASHNSSICGKRLHNTGSDSSWENPTRNDDPEKWRHYATKTGQLSGYLINARNCTTSSKSKGKEVWKPAFSLNTTSSLVTNYPSLNQSATAEIISSSKNTRARITEDSRDDGITLETAKEEGNISHGRFDVSPTSPEKKSLTNNDLNEDKTKMLQRQEELEYLGFISGITQDILSRRCLSDAALELLIWCHVERNLHRLDKDKMMERVAELKEQLGVTT